MDPPTPVLGNSGLNPTENKTENSSFLTSSAKMESESEPEKIEKHTIHPLLSPTKSTRLTMGSRVIILGTDNVEQRVPQYVGLEAEIVVVPVHPATWFKVKFDNGKIVTFRPSALRLVSDGTTVDANYSPPPKKPKSTSRPRSNSLKNENSKSALHVTVPKHGSNRLLTSIHPDLWPGCKVRILSGRMTGHTAKVLGSGNGWVQLESSYGELAKRATELELVSRGSSASQDDKLSDLTVTAPNASVRPILQRRRSNSEPGSPTEISNRRNEFSTKNNMRKERKEMALQREYVQRYIDKQQAKIGTRPDLKYWLSRIQGTMVDPTFERNISRDVRSHFCHSCYMEMWSGSKYCWNEYCSASPVYWKLAATGVDRKNPLERYKRAAATANAPAPLNVEVSLEDSAYACEVLLSLRSDIRMPTPSNEVLPERSSVSFAPTGETSSLSSESQTIGMKRKLASEIKSKRSDSSYTDSEDLNDDGQPAALKLKIRMSPSKQSSTLSSTSPLKLNSPRPNSTSPRANSNSPRLNFKRIRVRSASPFAAAQGAPPSAEEFARIVRQHEQEQQQRQQHQLHAPISDPNVNSKYSTGPLPGLVSGSQVAPFNNNITATSPLLTSLLNPDYPTNNAVVANVLPKSSQDSA